MNPSPDYQSGRDSARTLQDLGYDAGDLRFEAMKHWGDFRQGLLDVAAEIESEQLGAV